MKTVYGEDIEDDSKVCNRCKKDQPLFNYGNDSGGKKLRSWCKPCDKEVSKDRAKIRKDAPSVSANHKCPICKKNEAQLNETIQYRSRKVSPWVCDHDHKNKAFRGWLCRKCNLGLGNFADNPKLLKRAAEWVEKKR